MAICGRWQTVNGAEWLNITRLGLTVGRQRIVAISPRAAGYKTPLLR